MGRDAGGGDIGAKAVEHESECCRSSLQRAQPCEVRGGGEWGGGGGGGPPLTGLPSLTLSATLRWSRAAGALGQRACYRVTVSSSAQPRNPTSWSTVSSAYRFGGNGERPELAGRSPWSLSSGPRSQEEEQAFRVPAACAPWPRTCAVSSVSS